MTGRQGEGTGPQGGDLPKLVRPAAWAGHTHTHGGRASLSPCVCVCVCVCVSVCGQLPARKVAFTRLGFGTHRPICKADSGTFETDKLRYCDPAKGSFSFLLAASGCTSFPVIIYSVSCLCALIKIVAFFISLVNFHE